MVSVTSIDWKVWKGSQSTLNEMQFVGEGGGFPSLQYSFYQSPSSSRTASLLARSTQSPL